MRMASLQMFQLGEAWNHNMAQQFLPSWINVLDESMMGWFNKWSPGFMCVVRKPHPFGNDRHTHHDRQKTLGGGQNGREGVRLV